MNRRLLKKQIQQRAQRLITPVHQYLGATSQVHPDVISSYETQLEMAVYGLMRLYLILDPSWPHYKRWLDGFSEEFNWARKGALIHGSGKMFWGYWPDVSREITGLSFNATLQLCPKHGVDYVFLYAAGDNLKRYSSRRCVNFAGASNRSVNASGIR